MKVDFDIVAANLGCTPRAVQERLKKLRKMAAENATSDPTAAAAVVGPKTPTKLKTKSPTKTKGAAPGGDAVTPSRKKRKTATPKGGKGASAGAGAAKGVVKEEKGQEISAEMAGDVEAVDGGGHMAGEVEGMGEYTMGPEMSQVVKEEDLLDESHDPVLYDAQIGLLSSEI